MPFDLDRFRKAQESEFAIALAELRAGQKRSHWIWYVFPQLRGLGSSPAAVLYGLDGLAEAEAYLRDDLLRERLRQAAGAVYDAVCGRRAKLDTLMGSQIDALKLVSSLTLFEQATRVRHTATESPDDAKLVDTITTILDAVDTQGYPRCAFTLERISS